ncbi:hypothetical protein Tco_1419333, partial [Tanacetum coccineum]
MRKRIDDFNSLGEQLELDHTCPLKELDPITRLNKLAKSKRKNLDELQDYLKSTKRYKLYVQFNDHPAINVLNESTLGMNLFNAPHRQDFININDFGELNNDMLYNVQEIFHRLHRGPGKDDIARTFSSFRLVEVDKR